MNTGIANNTLLVYNMSESGAYKASRESFLTSAAFLEEGIIKDRLFDSFLFLPSPSFIYGSGGKKALKKKDLLYYFENGPFAPGYNLDALEQAAEEINTALGSEYKYEIVLSITPPSENITDFGEAGGRSLDFTNIEDMKTAVRWMVDEQITLFEKRNYKNLKLTGFYWFHESIDPAESKTAEVIRCFTDYTRAAGLYSCWIPFHGAQGCGSNSIFGFDRINMQVNFFPGNPGYPNNYAYSEYFGHQTACQSFERAAGIIEPNGLGYELEFGGDVNNEKGVTGFKIYLLYGVKKGFINQNRAYYLGDSLKAVKELYSAEDDYVKSTYTQLYKFIKGSLRESDITLKPRNADVILAKDW